MSTPARDQAKPLTTRQKSVLCQIAGRAWNSIGSQMGYADCTEFRHACVFDVTGRDGLTACDQLDYIPLYNYWAGMLGLPLREDRTPKTALDRALHILRDALARWEYSTGYAVTLMRARLGVLATGHMPLNHLARLLGAEGVRQVAYTVINRGREKTARLNAAGGWDTPVTEPHSTPSTLPPGGLAGHFGAILAPPVHTPCTRPAGKEACHA